MRGFELDERGGAVTHDAGGGEPHQQAGSLEALPMNPILGAVYEQKERNRQLFKRFIIVRSVPEPIHAIRRTPYIGIYEGEQNG